MVFAVIINRDSDYLSVTHKEDVPNKSFWRMAQTPSLNSTRRSPFAPLRENQGRETARYAVAQPQTTRGHFVCDSDRRPVREASQNPVEFVVGSERPSGGPLRAACEAPECRLVVRVQEPARLPPSMG